MKTTRLYRPVGVKELELISLSGFKKYPLRLPGQPIFYPVMNFEYAARIAEEWNTKDAFSGYAGFVTEFEINSNFISKYPVKNVGGEGIDELWVPSEDLGEFNNQIIGKIEVSKAFYGDLFEGEKLVF